MRIKPINGPSRLRSCPGACRRIVGCQAQTKGDEFEILVILIEGLRKTSYKILPPDPIEASNLSGM